MEKKPLRIAFACDYGEQSVLAAHHLRKILEQSGATHIKVGHIGLLRRELEISFSNRRTPGKLLKHIRDFDLVLVLRPKSIPKANWFRKIFQRKTMEALDEKLIHPSEWATPFEAEIESEPSESPDEVDEFPARCAFEYLKSKGHV